ncbi:MAG: twin-arginine translocase TatA/TatE family subunit [Candidatus Eremiobacteraeota bacterium]|nr:twin-arginine translocase TatA/TatE family subunit [Candidatus Eremiobacteraeota bacterium]
MNLGPFEIVALAFLAVLIFGTAPFIRAGSAIGQSVKEFRKAVATSEAAEPEKLEAPQGDASEKA